MRTITESGYVLESDDLIVGNSASDVVLSFLPAVGRGRQVVVKNIGTGILYVTAPGTIDGDKVINLQANESVVVVDYEIGKRVTVGMDPVYRVVGRVTDFIAAPNTIDATKNVIENLSLLDTKKSLVTVKKTIGWGGTRSEGTITIDDTPVADETITIGGDVYTFKASRAEDFEIAISATPATQATNIETAVTADSATVTASAADEVCTITAVAVGVDGDSLLLDSEATGVAIVAMAGGADPAAADFVFDADANTTEQVFEMEDILPARCKLINLTLITEEGFADGVTVTCDIGTSTGDDDLIAAADMQAANTIEEGALGALFSIKTNIAAQSVFASITPGANWNLITAGLLSVYISYIDITNV